MTKIRRKSGSARGAWLQTEIWLGPEPFYSYVQGYTIAVKTLLRRAQRKPRELKYLLFPLVFNFRQAVELYLKNIIFLSQSFEKKGLRYPEGHSLSRLWDTAQEIVGPGFSPKEWKQARSSKMTILTLARIDQAGDKFRFPESLNGRAFFSGSTSVALSKKDMLQTLDFLDTIAFAMRNQAS